MEPRQRLSLIMRNAVEVITEGELREALESGRRLRGYIGFEPSGVSHVGWLVWAYKFKDLVEAGIDMILFAATWHAWINDKLGGRLELIRAAAKHVVKMLEAIGVERTRFRVVYADEVVERPEYWAKLLKLAKHASLSRVRRALTIMGRRAEEAELDFSKLIYPLMQVTDIFDMEIDIALGGMDQRKAHMLARDLAEKLGWKKPIAIHTPIVPALHGMRKMVSTEEIDEILSEHKMSKSKPHSAILLTDAEEEIRRKIREAYCPPRTIEGNPIMYIAKYIVFAQGSKELFIERRPEHGGPLEVHSYEELEDLYVKGLLHPLDLKNAVAEELIKIIRPIRRVLQSDHELWRELQEIEAEVAR